MTPTPTVTRAGRAPDLAGLIVGARAGLPHPLARLISLVEAGHPAVRELMVALAPFGADARVIGLTGPPGVGKSTTTSALIAAFRAVGQRVGVLAVDPSSPFSGGALLGDRVRMREHAVDPGVFIRSMASRGQFGGLAWSTPQALRVLEASGFDVVLIETVGVGQSEVQIAGLADTTVVLLAPGSGDGIQAAKAGVLEIGDVFVVNKADRDGAVQAARDLRHMITLTAGPAQQQWRPPVLQTVASAGQGIDELVQALDRHHDWLRSGDGLQVRRRHRAAVEIEAIVLAEFAGRMAHTTRSAALDQLAGQVVAGRLDVYTAADQLIAAVSTDGTGPAPSAR